MLAGTTTSAPESGVILSTIGSVGEEVDSWLLSTRLPGFVSKEESCNVPVIPESKTGVSGDLGISNNDISYRLKLKIQLNRNELAKIS